MLVFILRDFKIQMTYEFVQPLVDYGEDYLSCMVVTIEKPAALTPLA